MSENTLSGGATSAGTNGQASATPVDPDAGLNTLSGASTNSGAAVGDSTASDFGTAAQDLAGPEIEVVDLSLRYDVTDRLGGGGMGEVYRGLDRRLNRPVAIKRLKSELARDQRLLQRFVDEARTVAALSHAHIIHVYDYGRDAQGPFLILEFIDGESLAERLKRGALELAEAVRLLIPICEATAFANARGVIHRDIKPANILLTSNGDAKLGDFGIARQTLDVGQTTAGVILGTFDYMSPEQQTDSTQVDARSDLWSLACTVYEALTRCSPRYFEPDLLPASVRDVIVRARRVDPAERYASAKEFAAALREAAAAKPPADATEELQVGECPQCRTINPLDRKFCKTHSCRAPLHEPCPVCERTLPVWELVCGECGADIPESWMQREREVAEKQHQVATLASEYRFAEADAVLAELALLDGRRWEEVKSWVHSRTEQLREMQAENERFRASMVDQATTMLNASAYDFALDSLNMIPGPLQNTEVQVLRKTAQARQDEFVAIMDELQDMIQTKKLTGLRAKIDRALELSPSDPRVTAMDRRLREREAHEEQVRQETLAKLDAMEKRAEEEIANRQRKAEEEKARRKQEQRDAKRREHVEQELKWVNAQKARSEAESNSRRQFEAAYQQARQAEDRLNCASSKNEDPKGDANLPALHDLESIIELYRSAADAGHPAAMARMGDAYWHGLGVSKDVKAAVNWYRRAAAEGDPSGMAGLARALWEGKEFRPKPDEAHKLFRRSAEAGCVEGMVGLANTYWEEGPAGWGGHQDPAKAIVWYRKAAEHKHPEAMLQLGRAYINGKGVDRNIQEGIAWLKHACEEGHPTAMSLVGKVVLKLASEQPEQSESQMTALESVLRWYRQAAEAGDVDAMLDLARRYRDGSVLPTDPSESVRWFGKAAATGNVDAMYELGTLLWEEKGQPGNKAEAIDLFRKAADLNHAESAYVLGLICLTGNGAPQSAPDAVRYLEQAAEAGHVPAIQKLVRLYSEGHEVPQSDYQAATWLKQLVKLGNVDAQAALGQRYLTGRGVRPNWEFGLKCIRESAENGSADGMNLLGKAYEEGQVIKKDRAAARQWYEKAAASGHEEARENLDRLNNKPRWWWR